MAVKDDVRSAWMNPEGKSSVITQEITDKYALYNGDCVTVLKGVPSNSIGFTLFSPPFAQLYSYSDDDADMGNSKS